MEIEIRECKKHGLTEFRSSKRRGRNTLRWNCRFCASEYSIRHYTNSPKTQSNTREASKRRKKKMRQFMWNYFLAHPCVICGEVDPIVLELDHIDHKTKSFGLSESIHTKSFEVFMTELNKCQVMCANCHKRKTAATFNWYHDVIKEGS